MSSETLSSICEGAWKGLLEEVGEEGFTNKRLREYLLDKRGQELKALGIVKLTPQSLRVTLNDAVERRVLNVNKDGKLHIYHKGDVAVADPVAAKTGTKGETLKRRKTRRSKPAASGQTAAHTAQLQELQTQLEDMTTELSQLRQSEAVSNTQLTSLQEERDRLQSLLEALGEAPAQTEVTDALAEVKGQAAELKVAVTGHDEKLATMGTAIEVLATRITELISRLPAAAGVVTPPPNHSSRLSRSYGWVWGRRGWLGRTVAALAIVILILLLGVRVFGVKTAEFYASYQSSKLQSVAEEEDGTEATKKLDQQIDNEIKALETARAERRR